MENRRLDGTSGKLIRTGVLAVAAVISAQQKMPVAQACYTCEWNVTGGYSCPTGPEWPYFACIPHSDGCEIWGEGCGGC
jgi:hypothetical protein